MSVKERASIANPTYAATAPELPTYATSDGAGTLSNHGSSCQDGASADDDDDVAAGGFAAWPAGAIRADEVAIKSQKKYVVPKRPLTRPKDRPLENPTNAPVGGLPPFVSPIYHIPTEGGDGEYLEVIANGSGISTQPMYRTLDSAEAGQRGIVAQPAYNRITKPATPFETPTYQILAQPTRGAGAESVYNKLRAGSVANGVEATAVPIEAAPIGAESSSAYATAGLVGPDSSSNI